MKRWIYGNSRHLIKALEALGYEKWKRGAGFRRRQFHVIIQEHSQGKIRIDIHKDLPRAIVDPLPHKVVRRGDMEGVQQNYS